MPSKYRQGGLGRASFFRRKRWSLQRRLRKIEEIYRRETVKIVVSDYLKALLEKSYGAECHSVPKGSILKSFAPP